MIVLATLADALVTELTTLSANSTYQSSGGQTFTPTRAYLHELNMTTTPAFTASVAPATKGTSDAARGVTQTDAEFTVTFSKRLTNVTNAIADPLMKSVELVQEFFDDNHALTGVTGARVTGSVIDAGGTGEVYDEAQLDTKNFFFAQLTVTVQAWE